MKVFFTVPAISYITDKPPIMQDLGLGYLAAIVRKQGHTVSIRDWNMDMASERYAEAVREASPDVVCMKVFTKDVGAAVRTIETVRAECPSAKIVVGGPHPSAVQPEEVFEDLNGIDYSIRGEGEAGLPLLLNYISSGVENGSGNLLSGIPGLVWKENGRVRGNPVKLDDVGNYGLPAWDLLNPAGYPPIKGLEPLETQGYSAPFITSRGCPGVCSFCSVKMISGVKVRRKPLGMIMDELSMLYSDYNVRSLMIMDNGFLVDEEFVQEMCASMIDKGFNFKWDCVLIDIGRVLKEKTVEMMKKAGCVMVNLGVESGSERVRASIKKLNSLETVTDTVRLFRKYDIDLFGFFMLGFPAETRKEMQESIRLAKTLDFRMVSFTICYPIPGTKVYEFIRDKYKIKRIDWKTFNIHESPYPCSELKSSELSRLARAKNLEFMVRKNPKMLYRKILNRFSK
ncbi:MAG: B12-binding domain-containing radical SAM protein [Deltaproteobacteria bacterium]|nr:B12-binding domain-containing radical SAM protein [Deltaproteobacteria bacterium]